MHDGRAVGMGVATVRGDGDRDGRDERGVLSEGGRVELEELAAVCADPKVPAQHQGECRCLGCEEARAAAHRPLCEKHMAVTSVVPKPCTPASHPESGRPKISVRSGEGKERKVNVQPTCAPLALQSSTRTPAAMATRSPLTAVTVMSA